MIDFAGNLLAFVRDHYVELLAVLGALVAALKVIAPLTPTQYDDKAVAGLSWFVDKLVSAVSPKSKRLS